jgi:hypothetical protein
MNAAPDLRGVRISGTGRGVEAGINGDWPG